MSSIPSEEDCIRMLLDAGCKRRVVIHCCTVEAVAKEMLSRITDADPELTMAGALLHDIGRSVDHSIMHAYIGSQIVQAEGMPQELVDIVRKHTGAGLDEEDVAEMNLPPADYMPRTLEEKIVAHADNLVSDNRVHRELSRLYGEDMDVIPERIGQYPDLPLARRFDLL